MAVEKKELPQLEKLYQRGLENGVKDLKILNSKEIKEVEPYCEVRMTCFQILSRFYVCLPPLMTCLIKLLTFLSYNKVTVLLVYYLIGEDISFLISFVITWAQLFKRQLTLFFQLNINQGFHLAH